MTTRPYANEQSFPTAELEKDVRDALDRIAGIARIGSHVSPVTDAAFELGTVIRTANRALAKLEELKARQKGRAA